MKKILIIITLIAPVALGELKKNYESEGFSLNNKAAKPQKITSKIPEGVKIKYRDTTNLKDTYKKYADKIIYSKGNTTREEYVPKYVQNTEDKVPILILPNGKEIRVRANALLHVPNTVQKKMVKIKDLSKTNSSMTDPLFSRIKGQESENTISIKKYDLENAKKLNKIAVVIGKDGKGTTKTIKFK